MDQRMEQVWEPTQWGMVFTRSEAWRLALGGKALRVTQQGGETSIPLERAIIQVAKGMFWSKLRVLDDSAHVATLDGIPNRFAVEVGERLHDALRAARKREADQAKIRRLNEHLPRIVAWSQRSAWEMTSLFAAKRLLTEERILGWKANRPNLGVALTAPLVAACISQRPEPEKLAIQLWQRDIRESAQEQIKTLVNQELIDCKDFFDRVEKSELTEEQARAVLCFDNRVLVVASAGSGKTSTMVAKAGYALHRGLFESSEILLALKNLRMT